MKKLARHEITVLKLIAQNNGAGSLDAVDFADEIISLMQAGFVELHGTLAEPKIAATTRGLQALDLQLPTQQRARMVSTKAAGES